jgi:hypothetical protein
MGRLLQSEEGRGGGHNEEGCRGEGCGGGRGESNAAEEVAGKTADEALSSAALFTVASSAALFALHAAY